jgi:hypothetical protein
MPQPKMSKERKKELEKVIFEMSDASEAFYGSAVRIGNHAFIEFCGLMNEYIKLCEEALRNGIDFTGLNIHTGKGLVIHGHNVDYIKEKMECIFSGQLSVVKE